MPLKIEDIKVKGYERVIHATNEITKLDCVIVIHNTKLGPALGGVRSWEYSNFEQQKEDALRLSEAMTLKNSVCGINFGGGKAALNLKNVKKTPELYQSYGEVVEFLNGKYLTAGDVNTFVLWIILFELFSKYHLYITSSSINNNFSKSLSSFSLNSSIYFLTKPPNNKSISLNPLCIDL